LFQALLLMLEKHGHRRAVFSGHSLGSVYLSWMCRLAPHAVAASVFIEPIVFMLYLKTVTSSFLYHDYGGIVGTHWPSPSVYPYMHHDIVEEGGGPLLSSLRRISPL
jgi:hypothetical protein